MSFHLNTIHDFTCSPAICKHSPGEPKGSGEEPEQHPAAEAKPAAEAHHVPAHPEKKEEQPLAPEILKVQQETRFSMLRFLKNILVEPARKVARLFKRG